MFDISKVHQLTEVSKKMMTKGKKSEITTKILKLVYDE